ncbi:MAG: hypothetical protein DRQ62_15840, partial [Gammaproteobacteria bacterium]
VEGHGSAGNGGGGKINNTQVIAIGIVVVGHHVDIDGRILLHAGDVHVGVGRQRVGEGRGNGKLVFINGLLAFLEHGANGHGAEGDLVATHGIGLIGQMVGGPVVGILMEERTGGHGVFIFADSVSPGVVALGAPYIVPARRGQGFRVPPGRLHFPQRNVAGVGGVEIFGADNGGGQDDADVHVADHHHFVKQGVKLILGQHVVNVPAVAVVCGNRHIQPKLKLDDFAIGHATAAGGSGGHLGADVGDSGRAIDR